MPFRKRLVLLFWLLAILPGCEITPVYPTEAVAARLASRANTAVTTPAPAPTIDPTPALTATPTATTAATSTPTASPTAAATPTATVTPTALPTPTPTRTPRPTRTPLPTPLPVCAERTTGDDLLLIISREHPVSRDYLPRDLVPLSQYFDTRVTLGYDTWIRATVIGPLQGIVAEMQAAGLNPTIISGYRSYEEQGVAWRKWRVQYPDRAAWFSALPGTSEHQLGTAVDFGSPELVNEFHTHFAHTGEGVWLLANAHRYGFALSYPRGAFEVTRFQYEPWHYRYVGAELATLLHETKTPLLGWQLENLPPPCVPE